MQRIGWNAIALIALMTVSVDAGAEETAAGRSVFGVRGTRHYRVTHEVTLTPVGRSPFSRVALVVPVPVNLPHQRVQGEPTVQIAPLQVQPLPIRTTNSRFVLANSEPFGQPVMKIDLKRPAVVQEWRVSLTYEVDVANLVFDVARVRQVEFGRLTNPDASVAIYLRPETLVESDHPELRAALGQLFPDGIDPKAPAYDVAWAIYKWVLEHSTYQSNAERGRVSKLWGALDLLRTRRGECCEYTALFVALCRAAGIPARSQVGFWTKKELSPHVWSEFYLPGVGWVPVDPSSGDDPRNDLTEWFGNLPDLNQRVTVTVGYDHQVVDLKMDFLQEYAYWVWYDGKPARLEAGCRFLTERGS